MKRMIRIVANYKEMDSQMVSAMVFKPRGMPVQHPFDKKHSPVDPG